MISIFSKLRRINGGQGILNASGDRRLLFLFRDLLLYGGAWTLSKMMALLTIPILTRVFSSAEYGIIDAITVLGSISVAFITMGQDSAVARFYYDTEDPAERREIISQALFIQIALCGMVIVGLLFAADSIIQWMIKRPGYVKAFYVLIVSYPFMILFQFFQNLSKWMFNRSLFIFLSVGSNFSLLVLIFLLVSVFDLGVMGVFYAQLLSFGLLAFLGLFACRKYLVLRWNFSYRWRMLRFGCPYMFVAVAGMMIPALDRMFITRSLTLEMLGYYAVGYKTAFLVSLPITAFQTAWGPFMFATYKEPNAIENFNKVLIYYTAFISLLGYCLVATAEPLIMFLASSRYLEGSVVVLPLVFSLIIESIAWIMGIGIDLSKKTYGNAISYAIGGIVSGITIWMMIERYGFSGVAYGVMFGRIAQAITYVVFAYQVYPLRFAWKNPGIILLLTFVSAVLFQMISLPAPLYHIAFRFGSLIMLTGIVWGWVLSPEERGYIVNQFRSAQVAESGS